MVTGHKCLRNKLPPNQSIELFIMLTKDLPHDRPCTNLIVLNENMSGLTQEGTILASCMICYFDTHHMSLSKNLH